MIITLIQRDSTFESPSKPLLQLPEQPDQETDVTEVVNEIIPQNN